MVLSSSENCTNPGLPVFWVHFSVKDGILLQVHSEERKFACQNCDFKAKSIVILNRHIERVHKNNLKHLCSHCGKKFFRAYDLRCHIFRVHKDIQGKIFLYLLHRLFTVTLLVTSILTRLLNEAR